MTIYELAIKCPVCGTVTTIVAQESNPLIFMCTGCSKSVIMQGNTLYTVSSSYINTILKKFRHISCGQVVSVVVSDEAKELITEEKINNLHDLLQKKVDVSDIINKL